MISVIKYVFIVKCPYHFLTVALYLFVFTFVMKFLVQQYPLKLNSLKQISLHKNKHISGPTNPI